MSDRSAARRTGARPGSVRTALVTVALAGLALGIGSPASATTRPATTRPATTVPARALPKAVSPQVAANAAADLPVTVPPHPGTFVPLTPVRLLDTASGNGAPAGAVPSHHAVTFLVAGRGGVPATGAGTALLNVTVASPTAGGYATVYASGTTRPQTSNLNFRAGRTAPNLVTAALGSDGRVTIYNGSLGTVRLVADVSGYFVAGAPTDPGAFRALTPARVLDTAADIGAAPASAAARHTAVLTVAGRGGVPSTGVSAVVLNVTVAGPSASGYVTVYPYGGSRPGTSSVNFPSGRTVPNLVVVQLGSSGRVSLYNGSDRSVRLVADVFGYFRSGTPAWGGTLNSLRPARLIDTRTGRGPMEGAENGYVPAHGRVHVFLDMATSGLPAYGGAAVVLNVTVTQTHRAGYITVYPSDVSQPLASNLNFTADDTVANAVVVKPASYGGIYLYNSSDRSVQLVVDVSGYILAKPAIHFRNYAQIDQHFSSQSISCPTTTFCMATAGSGRLQRYNGSTWTTPTAVFDLEFAEAVSCPNTTFCMAVSGYGDSSRFNGSTWSDPAGPLSMGGIGAIAVSCVSSTFCVAVDQDGKAHRWNGSSWKTWTISSQLLAAVSCPTTTFCMAVDEAGRAIRFNGTSWATSVGFGPQGVGGLTCVSTRFCEFVDLPGNARTFNGTSWSPSQPTGLSNGVTLTCASTTSCLASGGGAAAAFNGTSWAPAGDLAGDSLGAVDCATTTFCAAVTSDGYERTYNGSSWGAAIRLDPAFGDVSAISCSAAGFCAAVSQNGLLSFGSGSSWGATHVLFARDPIVDVSCRGTTFCMVVGNSRSRWYDNGVWSAPVTVDASGTLHGVSCASSTSCLAVDGNGSAFRFDGSSWSSAGDVDAVSHDPVAVSCPSTTWCAVVEASGYVVTWNGTTFGAPVAIGPGVDSISCPTTTMCLTAGFDGDVWRMDGTTWTGPTQLTPVGYSLSSVSCGTPNLCVATSDSTGDAYTLTNEGWVATNDAPFGVLLASCASTTFCVGANGDTGVLGQRT